MPLPTHHGKDPVHIWLGHRILISVCFFVQRLRDLPARRLDMVGSLHLWLGVRYKHAALSKWIYQSNALAGAF
jgi:hypothetical protein